MTCSQLSRTMRMGWSRSVEIRVSIGDRSDSTRSSRASATARGTSDGSLTGASSTSQTPSPRSSSTSAAAWRARRVFPDPPAPVSVTRRPVPSSPTTSASSSTRPTNGLSEAGRLLGSSGLSSDRSGGNPSRRPLARSWNSVSGRPRSRNRCGPRARSAASPGRLPSSRPETPPGSSALADKAPRRPGAQAGAAETRHVVHARRVPDGRRVHIV